ncbi:MAG: carboxypeptidase-like regulatory domain-containing protein, partial [Bacteroidales bacterium]|nr:carboxypeptidase-like regulatory domain-containing protein [Bacteroidales bacterium]
MMCKTGFFTACLLAATMTVQSGTAPDDNNLLTSRHTSYLTYIYRIGNDEARRIYSGKRAADDSFLHTLADTYPTDSAYAKPLAPGHYLKVWTDGADRRFAVTSVQPFDVFILNNNTDLRIQVLDLQGNIIDNAVVKVGAERLRYQGDSRLYIDRKSNLDGLLTVARDGFTAFYRLEKSTNNSWTKRAYFNTVSKPPIRYVWTPVRYAARLPYDGVRSVIEKRPTGVIASTKWRMSRVVRKDRNIQGYMVFSKPKYMPGDTVKFKAFVLLNGKPYKKPLNAGINGVKSDLQSGLKPYRPGAFEGQFPLADTLKLKLDHHYSVALWNSSGDLITQTFRYEDYELKRLKFEMRTDEKQHHHGVPFKLLLRGADDNDLTLPDARVRLLLTPASMQMQSAEDHNFMPDTLLYFESPLKASGETEILLSDYRFPKAMFTYKITAELLTSDNEKLTKTEQITYLYKEQKLDMTLKDDSISVRYLVDGKEQPKHILLYAADNFNNLTQVYAGQTPCAVKFDPFYARYMAKTDSLTENLHVASLDPQLLFATRRDSKKITVAANNPLRLPFNYVIYRHDNEVMRGFTDSLHIEKRTGSKQNWFATVNYLWGGQIRNDTYRIPLLDNKLKVDVNQPPVIYPGQRVPIELTVTDARNKPVEGADITAFSLTKKLEYIVPQVPDFNKRRPDKSIINNFNFGKLENNVPSPELDYPTWKALAGLDSVEYYKFLYPDGGIYRYEYATPDSITQFAPFITDNGKIVPAQIIRVDDAPVYFAWTTAQAPYSFAINTYEHTIKIRTKENLITLNKFTVPFKKKLIFSIDLNNPPEGITVEAAAPKLSDAEKRELINYVVPYRTPKLGKGFSWLRDFNVNAARDNADGYINYQLLSSFFANTEKAGFAGPLAGILTFETSDSTKIRFTNEPFYEYEFAPSLIKMRSLNIKAYPLNLDNATVKPLNDVVLTKAHIDSLWRRMIDIQRWSQASANNPQKTTAGNGRLRLELQFNQQNRYQDYLQYLPLNMLLMRYDDLDFLRVYAGVPGECHQLEPGYYRAVLFYSGARYYVRDSLQVKANGAAYYRLNPPETLQKDTFSMHFSNMIEKAVFKPINIRDESMALLDTYDANRAAKNTGDGFHIEGYVYDEAGEPLSGATVLVKGTNTGAITNVNGYYSLNVPNGKRTLSFESIGYESQEIQIRGYVVNVQMQPRTKFELNEIVVVGFGSAKRTSTVASISTMERAEDAMAGHVTGINFKNAGDGSNFFLRGLSAADLNGNPLIIIDGKVASANALATIPPDNIRSFRVVKDDSMTALYGSRAADGVIIIETNSAARFADANNALATGNDALLMPEGVAAALRTNFSDVAFWQPRLQTDKQGKARLDVTFPDDITNWDTHYMVMSDRKSGQATASAKSFKPLSAQLALPRFILPGDTAMVVGKTVNYAPDSLQVTTRFELDGHPAGIRPDRWCPSALLDTLPLTATAIAADSIAVKYMLEKGDYFDGELRYVPVKNVGLEDTKGGFIALDADTAIQLSADPALGEATIYARSDAADVLRDEIIHVAQYRYSCNEQLASRLKVMLADRMLARARNEELKYDDDIRKLIRELKKTQLPDGLWGWWQGSTESKWISLHILEALMQTKADGFAVNINERELATRLIYKAESAANFSDGLWCLRMLSLLDATADVPKYIARLEAMATDRKYRPMLHDRLQIMLLKQQYKMPVSMDSLKA